MTPGSLLGPYCAVRKLGAGGLDTVYLAELPTLAVHAEIVDRFFTEARATSAIADAGVVQVLGLGVAGTGDHGRRGARAVLPAVTPA